MNEKELFIVQQIIGIFERQAVALEQLVEIQKQLIKEDAENVGED